MPQKWGKWDIVYVSKFPESFKCTSCGEPFLIQKSPCEHCKEDNNISSIIAKARPILLWIEQDRWFNSLTFGIPLSKTQIRESKYEQPIYLSDYQFLHKNKEKNIAMRATIAQATRFDGNCLREKDLVGKLNNKKIQSLIENKLFSWIFGDYETTPTPKGDIL